GPDFRQQMLRENVKQLDAVIFTHEHKDHLAGFDDIRAFNYLTKKPMEVYATQNVVNAIKREFPYIFEKIKYPGVPEINLHLIDEKPFEIEGIKFIPIQVMHHKLPVFGYRVGDFTYITDANFISDEEKKKVFGTKVLVLNALRKETHISHFTFDEAIQLAKYFNADKTFFTHISHQLGLHKNLEKELPENIHLAFDGLKIEI
ncbi:MAG TPA: MBL fold metallo-hydrolase, partial [Bacteroidia bacterium]|nr:MBL fold metallo-hydrolase [Bacteroidia bacterium]